MEFGRTNAGPQRYLGTWLVAMFAVAGLGFAAMWNPCRAQPPGSYSEPAPPAPPAADENAADDLDKLMELADRDFAEVSRVNVMAPSLEMEVTTVNRQVSTVGRSPAAVFVITNEMIRRSGARNIPEALRMVPGVQVARIDANKWAVSVRGFNSQFANKLLVQIDGRSIYTPLFGGVFWDVQDVVLEDVERIEVVRGPGATVWGANAVNGIINIITKQAKDTQGVLVQAGAGTEERGFTTLRYGGRLGQNAHYRLYGKWFERDQGYLPNNQAADDWGMVHGGFRVDWTPSDCDTVTVQGNTYDGRAGNRNLFPNPVNPPLAPGSIVNLTEDTNLRGGNAIVTWSRQIDEASNWMWRVYYDRTERIRPVSSLRECRDTVDFDFQHHFQLGECNSIIWGFGYRNTKGDFMGNPGIFEVTPNERAVDLISYFFQDEITLIDERLFFIAGSKFEHNDFTAFEYQPTGRLLWTPSPRHSLWSSISRAVRLPTVVGQDVQLTLLPQNTPFGPRYPQMVGSRDFEAEDLLAYEAGIRVQETEDFWWDLAVFYHHYNDLSGLVPQPVPGDFLPQEHDNDVDGQSYGFELAASYNLTPTWRLHAAYSFLRLNVQSPQFVIPTIPGGQDPRNQLYLRSSWDLATNWQLDVAWRYVDNLPSLGVPSYNVMDVRLAHFPSPEWEFSIVGQSLLDQSHYEFGADPFIGTIATEVQYAAYGMVTWRR